MYSIKITNKIFLSSLFCLFVSLSFFVISHDVYAQSISNQTKASIKLTPRYPTPGQKVTASLYSASLDRDTALITWRLNGEIIQQSYSGFTVTYTTGPVGSVSKLTVDAKDGRGVQVTAESVVKVSDIAVVWEGKTYTPPFYQGRALQTPGSDISLVALPSVIGDDGKLYSNEDLFYLWYVNNSLIPEISGKAKNSVVLRNANPLSSFKIHVVVKDSQGNIRASKHIKVPVSQPRILLYEDSPLIGIRYDKAIESPYGIFDREAIIVAEPFYISAQTRIDSVLKYTWSIAGEDYTKPGSIALGSDGVGSGSTNVRLVIKNTERWLQNARTDLKVDFGRNNAWGSDLNPETIAP